MSRVFITGSSTGLGLMTGRLLAEQGHQVVLHARDERRAGDARAALSAAAAIIIGDASRLKDLQRMAEQLNGMRRFDVLIHNVGVGYRESRRILTQDGLPHPKGDSDEDTCVLYQAN
jgi:short-subunit dehydrogenase